MGRVAMRPLRVYIDTSVFGGMFDKEFRVDTELFFQMAAAGRFQLVVSEQVEAEIKPSPQVVREFYDRVLPFSEFCLFSRAVHELSSLYVEHKVVGKKSSVDADHVALATVTKCDGLVSWNYKHIVSPDKSAKFNMINASSGYPQLFILSPREVILYEQA